MASGSLRKQTHVTTEVPFDGKSVSIVTPSKFTYEALSNVLVLQNIFGNLDKNDLEVCSLVSECWNSVAGQLFVRQYKIELLQDPECFNNPSKSEEMRKYFVIKTIPTRLTNKVKEFHLNLADACKFLEEASQKEHISLDLSNNLSKCYVNPIITHFLSKFGHLVQRFSEGISLPAGTLCEQIVKYFPNLKCLNLMDSFLVSTDSNSYTNRPEKQLKQLRTIYYMAKETSYNSLVAVLSIAPNLKEFYNFPILFVKALAITKNASVVKSLLIYSLTHNNDSDDESDYTDENENASDDEHENDTSNRETLETALEKFALLEPKLTEFSFQVRHRYKLFEIQSMGSVQSFYNSESFEFLCQEPRQSVVKRILESSRESLQRLSIYSMSSFDFSGLSPFTGLTTIQFLHWQADDPELFNNSKTDLNKLFPKVSILKMPKFGGFVQTCERLNKVPPWASQIVELRLNLHYDLDSVICFLSQIFPAVKKLQFSLKAVPEDLKPVIPAIAENWPGLETLAIKVLGCSKEDIKSPCTFDSVFTSIDDHILCELKHPLSSAKFTWPVKALQVNSTMLKMSSLKTLEMEFYNCMDSQRFIERLSTITLISKEFVFDFLPDLKFVFRLNPDKFPDRELTFYFLQNLSINLNNLTLQHHFLWLPVVVENWSVACRFAYSSFFTYEARN